MILYVKFILEKIEAENFANLSMAENFRYTKSKHYTALHQKIQVSRPLANPQD